MSAGLAAQRLVPSGFDWATSSRQHRVEVIQKMRRAEFTYKQIGLVLGLKSNTVRNVLNDPDGSKARARKKSYAGVCVDCGGPTDGSNGRGKAPLHCIYCAQGRPRPKLRLSVPVRLTDIPADVRLDAASAAARIESDENDRLELLLAAIEPSDTVYWVSESARPMVEQWSAAA